VQGWNVGETASALVTRTDKGKCLLIAKGKRSGGIVASVPNVAIWPRA
jgi:hypothetical protein